MKKPTITIILFAFCSYCKAQSPNLNNWKLDTLPTDNRIYAANNSPNNWTFIKKMGKWEIIQNPYNKAKGDSLPFTQEFIEKNLKKIKGNRYIKKIKDGYLVGLNRGEFGGGLYFINPNGLYGYEIAPYLRINKIFEYKKKYFAIEGLAHLGGNSGQIIEIFKKDTFWQYKSFRDLVESPALITDYKNEKIIVTSQYILKFGKNFKVKQILKSPIYWGMLYPSAILIDNNTDIYLAMRKGILKIKAFTTKPEYEWYVPK
jgi:hypothetical protein